MKTWTFTVSMHLQPTDDDMMTGAGPKRGVSTAIEVHSPDSFAVPTSRIVTAMNNGRTVTVLLEDTRVILLRRQASQPRETYELVCVVGQDPPDDDRPFPEVVVRFYGVANGGKDSDPRFESQGQDDGEEMSPGLNVTIKR